MKRLSMLFTLLVIGFASSSVYAQYTQGQLVDEWQRAKTYTKEYLDAMPADDYGFKPTPEIRTFAQQMLHLADGNYFMVSTATGQPSPMGQKSAEASVAQTKEATTRTVMESYDYVIKSLQDMTTAQLQEHAKAEGHEVTKFALFAKAFEHQTHHRGQTTIYLRLKGIKPPSERLF